MLLFEQTFYLSHNTKLVKGDSEPVYLPRSGMCQYHQLIFAHGYFASALHEISHWCLAGEERRLLEDFGYWYLPDGRTKKQQQHFEHVEIKPQAIEWAFSVSCNKNFIISADNLNGSATDSVDFKQSVYDQIHHYLIAGFPPRAQQFIAVLADFYQVQWPLNSAQFRPNGLADNQLNKVS